MKQIFLACLIFLTTFPTIGCGYFHPGTGNGNLPPKHCTVINGFCNQTDIPTGEPSDPSVAPTTKDTATLYQLFNYGRLLLATEPIPFLDGTTKPPIPGCMNVQPDGMAVIAVPQTQLHDCLSEKDYEKYTAPGATPAFCYGYTVVQSVLVYGNEDYCAEGSCWRNFYEMQNYMLSQPECGGNNSDR